MKNKKLNLENLALNKDVISNLDQFKGGVADFTAGCSDGCTGSSTFASSWNCTKETCTDDCQGPNSECVCPGKDPYALTDAQTDYLLSWNASDPDRNLL